MNATTEPLQPVVVEIDIEASPERVYQAWIDPAQRLAWWGDDQTYRTIRLDSDLRVGGKWLSEGRSMDGKTFIVQGSYTRIEPARALGFTWTPNWDGAPVAATHVLVEFIPTSSGTHVTITHSGFTETLPRENHSKGWTRVLGWLHNHVQAHK